MLTVVKKEFEKIKIRLDRNKLSLNFDKTHFMIFSNKEKCMNAPIIVHDVEIKMFGCHD